MLGLASLNYRVAGESLAIVDSTLE